MRYKYTLYKIQKISSYCATSAVCYRVNFRYSSYILTKKILYFLYFPEIHWVHWFSCFETGSAWHSLWERRPRQTALCARSSSPNGKLLVEVGDGFFLNVTQHDPVWHNLIYCNSEWPIMTYCDKHVPVWPNLIYCNSVWPIVTQHVQVWPNLTCHNLIWLPSIWRIGCRPLPTIEKEMKT